MFIDIEQLNLIKDVSKSKKIDKNNIILDERFFEYEVYGEIVFVKRKIEEQILYQLKSLNKRKLKRSYQASFNYIGISYTNEKFIKEILENRFPDFNFINLVPSKKEEFYNSKFYYTEKFLKNLKIDVDKNIKRISYDGYLKERNKWIYCIDTLSFSNILDFENLKDINFLIYTTDSNVFKSAYKFFTEASERIITFEVIKGVSVIYSVIQ